MINENCELKRVSSRSDTPGRLHAISPVLRDANSLRRILAALNNVARNNAILRIFPEGRISLVKSIYGSRYTLYIAHNALDL